MVLRLAQLSLVYTQERHGHHILVIHIGVALILNGLLVVGGGSRIGHLLLAVVVQDQERTHHKGNDNQQCHQNADHHPGALGQPMVRPLAVVLRGVVLAGGCVSRSLFHFKLRRAVTYAGGIIATG